MIIILIMILNYIDPKFCNIISLQSNLGDFSKGGWESKVVGSCEKFYSIYGLFFNILIGKLKNNFQEPKTLLPHFALEDFFMSGEILFK